MYERVDRGVAHRGWATFVHLVPRHDQGHGSVAELLDDGINEVDRQGPSDGLPCVVKVVVLLVRDHDMHKVGPVVLHVADGHAAVAEDDSWDTVNRVGDVRLPCDGDDEDGDLELLGKEGNLGLDLLGLAVEVAVGGRGC